MILANSIINVVHLDDFGWITTLTSVTKHQDIKQTAHEGTNVIKVSNFQVLTYKRFEAIRIEEHKTLGNFM